MRLVSQRLVLFAGLGLGIACSQVLDIQDAHVDPSLEAAQPNENAGRSSSDGSVTAASAAGAGETAAATGSTGSVSGAGPTAESGGAGGGNDAGPAEAGSAGAASEPTLCERYCERVMSNCTGKYEQYRTPEQCVEVCRRLPPGEPDDDEVNSVTCRLQQAEFAESEPFVYCKSAGPLGEGRCGSNCISYCSLMQATCTEASTAGNLEASYFESSQDCLDACALLPSDASGPRQYSASADAEPSSFVGNSVYCRTYHLAAALEQDTPDEHCPHAMGGDPCTPQ